MRRSAGALGYRRAVATGGDLPLWPVLALCGAFSAGLFFAADVLVVLLRGRGERTEFALYVLTFVAVLPAAVLAGFARSAAVGASTHALRFVAAVAVIAAGITVLGQRLLSEAPLWSGRLALAITLLPVVAVACLPVARLASASRIPPRAFDRPGAAGAVTLLGATTAVLAVAPASAFEPGTLAKALAAAVAATCVVLYGLTRTSRVPPRAGYLFDALFLVGVVLVLTNLGDGLAGFREHASYYVGPLNDVLHGRVLFVDSVSQYGAGVIYFLAAIFELIPLRLGTFQLVVSMLTALQFGIVYFTLRLMHSSRPLAALVVVVAIASTASFSLPTPNTSPLRFGLPFLLVALAVLASRPSPRPVSAWAAAVGVLALSSIWSLETFAFTGSAFVLIAAVRASAKESSRARYFARMLVVGTVAVVTAQVVFVAVSLAVSGELPDWRSYVQLVRVYTSAEFGTLPIPQWSPSFLLGAGYVLSGIAIATLLWRSRLHKGQVPALTVAAGYTGFGAAIFSYYVGRSHPIVLWDVAVPGIVLGGVWLSLLLDRRGGLARPTVLASVAICAAVATTLVDVAAPPVPVVRSHSALAALAGTSVEDGSLEQQLRKVWTSPPTTSVVEEGQQLARAWAPGGTPVAVLLPSEEVPELLSLIDRANAIQIAYPAADFLSARTVRRIVRSSRDLRPGSVLITTMPTWSAGSAPRVPPLRSSPRGPFAVIEAIAEAQQRRLALLLRQRFVTRLLGTTPGGLVAIRLVSRDRAEGRATRSSRRARLSEKPIRASPVELGMVRLPESRGTR